MRKRCLTLLSIATLNMYGTEDTGSCHRVLSVGSAIKQAARLDGKIVCVKGWMHGIPLKKDGMLFVDIVPIGTKSRHGMVKARIGITDWDEEFKIGEREYRPESFEKLDRLIAHSVNRDLVLEVVYRGVIMYRRGLFKTLHDKLPADAGGVYAELRAATGDFYYEVELILLEAISAKVIKLQ